MGSWMASSKILNETNEAYFDNKVIKNLVGLEYVVLRIKDLLSITFLEIKPGKNFVALYTNKKTGFIVVQGKAKLNLGMLTKRQEHSNQFQDNYSSKTIPFY